MTSVCTRLTVSFTVDSSVSNLLKSYDRRSSTRWISHERACGRVRFLDSSLFRISFSELNEPVYQVWLNRLKYPIGYLILWT